MTTPPHSTRVTPLDRAWDDALKAYLPTQGTKAREAAQKWGAQVAGLLAVVAVSTIFKGKETLDTIAPDRRDTVVLLVGLALIVSFTALLASAIAGKPEFKSEWATPDNMRLAQVKSVEDASKWTGISAICATVAFALSLSAAVMIWSNPKPASAVTNTLVVNAVGERACGELKIEADRLTVGGSALPSDPVAFLTINECP